jgi:beta-glucanase (GH16 family)
MVQVVFSLSVLSRILLKIPQLDGFGAGSFDWTTTDPANSYVNEEGLHIIPTLTNETTDINNDMIYNGYMLNLTGAGAYGTCTGLATEACSVSSNSTLGILIPPVRSARLTTQGKKTIKFGRVEVTAKMPVGDWLWPAICLLPWMLPGLKFWLIIGMMPEDSVYGVWPQSGEIDIMEARGNNYSYPGGRDVYSTTLHWGKITK